MKVKIIFLLILIWGSSLMHSEEQTQSSNFPFSESKQLCANPESNKTIEKESFNIEKKIKAPGPFPTGIAYDGKGLWVADRKSDLLYKIDPNNGNIIKSMPSPSIMPYGLAWDGKYLWVSDISDKMIYRIDVDQSTTIKSIEAPSPSAVGLAWDGKNLIVADNKDDEIYIISPDDGTAIRSFKAPTKDTMGLAYDGKYLWTSDRIRDEIYMIDYNKGDVIFYFPSPGKYAIGLTFDGKNLWNVDYQEKAIFSLKLPDKKFVLRNERYAYVSYTQEYHNFGPGKVKNIQLYISIPEDKDNQKIQEKINFNIQPQEYLQDASGQRVAAFFFQQLLPHQSLNIVMKTKVKTYEINYFIYPDKVGSLKDIPKDIKDKYLQDGEKYDYKNEIIQKAVKEAIGEEKNPYWIARKIYNYIIDHLEYELSGGWNPAPLVLKRGNGSCSEYSFLYIAMSRAAGLPSRYVGSVVVRGDDASIDEVFHRWVEVYIPNYGWIPVDPSGGDKPLPAEQAEYFGHLSNRFLITTQNAGASEYLGWTYNSDTKWLFENPSKVIEEHYAEWEPIPTQ